MTVSQHGGRAQYFVLYIKGRFRDQRGLLHLSGVFCLLCAAAEVGVPIRFLFFVNLTQAKVIWEE